MLNKLHPEELDYVILMMMTIRALKLITSTIADAVIEANQGAQLNAEAEAETKAETARRS